MFESHYQRFIFNMIGLTRDLCGPTIPQTGIVSDFGEESSGIRSLRIFSKPLAVNGFGMPLPTAV